MLRSPFPSCRDFPMARSGGQRFGRIYRTRPRCRKSSSTMSAWAIATSPRAMPIRRPNAPISSRRSGGISPSSRRRWSPSTFPRLSSWSTCDAGSSGLSGASPGRAGHTRRFHLQWRAVRGRALPPLVHHADLAPAPHPGPPALGALLRPVQDDGGGDVVQRLPGDGCRGPRAP